MAAQVVISTVSSIHPVQGTYYSGNEPGDFATSLKPNHNADMLHEQTDSAFEPHLFTSPSLLIPLYVRCTPVSRVPPHGADCLPDELSWLMQNAATRPGRRVRAGVQIECA
jgi:hypothetical protein